MMKLFRALVLTFACITGMPSSGRMMAAEATAPVVQEKAPRFTPIPKEIMYSSYRVKSQFGPFTGYGTGFAIDARTLITAGHVANGTETEKYYIELFDAEWNLVKTLDAKLKKTNGDADARPGTDLAILTVDEDLPYFHKLDKGEPALRDPIYCVGAPFGETPYHVSFGILVNRVNKTYPTLCTAEILGAPGNSGSAMFTADNKFIGILVRGGQAHVLFVPADTVFEFIKEDK